MELILVGNEEYKDAVSKMREQMQQRVCKEVYTKAVSKAQTIVKQVCFQAEDEANRQMVNSIRSRIKGPESIVRKLQKKGLTPVFTVAATRLNDLVGIRITCYFLDDIQTIAEKLKIHKDIHFIKEKDYITTPKESGYRSFHLIVEVPIEVNDTEQWIKAEIQIRTMAMDIWASMEHQLCYKKGQLEETLTSTELKECAEMVNHVDRKMVTMREEGSI